MASNVMKREQIVGFPWWLILLEGIALVILGLLFLTSPAMTSIFVVQFLGAYWLVAGIFRIVGIFVDNSLWGWKLIGGILGVIAGLVVIQHPIWAPLTVGSVIVIILGVEGILMGVINLIQAFQGAGWGVGLLGAISIIIGIILLGNLWVATFTLPLVLGVFALIGGIVSIVAAFQLK